MAVASLPASSQLAILKERNASKTKELKKELKEQKSLIRSLKQTRNELAEKIESIEAGYDGGMVASIVTLICGFGGLLVGYSLQRYIEGTSWTYKSVFANKLPVGSVASIGGAVLLAVPSRFAKTGAASFAVGVVGGAFMGRDKGKW